MKVLVIGGTGHVSRFTVPQLVEAGCEVIAAGSGRTPQPDGGAWSQVKYIACKTGEGKDISPLLDAGPEVVIEMCGHAWPTYQQMKGRVEHFIACGSVWMFGEPKVAPTPDEPQNPCPFPDYARRFQHIQQMIEQSPADGTAFTAIMPPNICGPGKVPLECMGGRSVDVHLSHAAGKEVMLPDGPEVLIGPCDAEDIARCFVQAALKRDRAAGHIFNVGSAFALTTTQLVNVFADIYNVKIPIHRVTWSDYIEKVNPDMGAWWHFKAHMCPDISKAMQLLDYQPHYTPAQTLARAVDWMREEKII